MPRAVLKNGVIQPLEPLPAEWQEGEELRVEQFAKGDWRQPTHEEVEQSMRKLEQMCADRDPEDERLMAEALERMKRESKEHMRRLMGMTDG
jgi:predicted DNA-binding antitoxin AbrB/MazE fold protein